MPVGRDGEWLIAGEGVLDLGGVLEALEGAGYEEWICVDEERDATLEEGLRQSRGWLGRRGLDVGQESAC